MRTLNIYNHTLNGESTPVLGYVSEEIGATTETMSSNGLEGLVPHILQRVGPSSKPRNIVESSKPLTTGESYLPTTEEQRTNLNKLLAPQKIHLVWVN